MFFLCLEQWFPKFSKLPPFFFCLLGYSPITYHLPCIHMPQLAPIPSAHSSFSPHCPPPSDSLTWFTQCSEEQYCPLWRTLIYNCCPDLHFMFGPSFISRSYISTCHLSGATLLDQVSQFVAFTWKQITDELFKPDPMVLLSSTSYTHCVFFGTKSTLNLHNFIFSAINNQHL